MPRFANVIAQSGNSNRSYIVHVGSYGGTIVYTTICVDADTCEVGMAGS